MASIFSRLARSRRWLQFSLRTMLLITLVCGVWLGWFVDRAQRQKRAVEKIEAGLMGKVVYRHEFSDDFVPPCPAWLCRLVGEEYFVEVVCVTAPLGDLRIVLKDSLQDLPWLEELHIAIQTPDDFASLQNLKRLKRLHLSNWSPDFRLECLHDSRGLEFLAFTGEGKQPEFEHLKEFGNLRELYIQSAAIGDKAMPHVAALQRLEHLMLACKISDEGLKPLEHLRRLDTLTIRARNITDAGAESLKKLTSLKTLSISGTKMTDRGLESLAGLPRLQSLKLSGDHFTGDAFSRLNKNLISITLFSLPRPICDADLESLERLTMLEGLFIHNDLHHPPQTTITDKGLATLKKMPRLKEISFESACVTKSGIADLKRALPACDVHIRN